MTDVKQEIAVVTGVLNKRSLAYGIVKAMRAQNIRVICPVQPEVLKRAKRDLDDDIVVLPCDVEGKLIITGGKPAFDADGKPMLDDNGEQLIAGGVPKYDEGDAGILSVVDYVREHHGKIQYLVHAIAHSDKAELEGDIRNVTRGNFHHTMEVSAFSFVRMALLFEPVMDERASISTLTFRGSSATAGSYFMMGMAKAALESSVRYLAKFYGKLNGTRVIAGAPGPVKTMAAMGIGDFDLSFEMGKVRSFLGENPDADQIGRTMLKVMQSEGITAAIIPIDGGIYDGVGMGTTDEEQEAYRLYLTHKKAAAADAKAQTD